MNYHRSVNIFGGGDSPPVSIRLELWNTVKQSDGYGQNSLTYPFLRNIDIEADFADFKITVGEACIAETAPNKSLTRRNIA